MRVHVAFTPNEAATAPTGIVIDVLRATSTIAQALAAGYARVLCVPELEDARALRAELAGQRRRRRARRCADRGLRRRRLAAGVPGGAGRDADPLDDERDPLDRHGRRALRRGSARLPLNLDAVAGAARRRGEDVAILCAGSRERSHSTTPTAPAGSSQLLGAEPSDAALAAEAIASAYPDALAGLSARTYGPPGLEDDIAFCAQESVLAVVPRFARMRGPAAEIWLCSRDRPASRATCACATSRR